jgi:DNA primase
MKYRGREVDSLALWGQYVDFPPNMESDQYLPLVVCPNPEHDTMKRHFQINTKDGLVHCFARCGISGTYQKAISIIEGCSEREAKKIILGFSRSGVGTKNQKRRSSTATRNPDVPKLEYSSYIPQAGIEFLDGRGISSGSIALWKIGWDEEELRIVIPVCDLQGHVKLLIKRAVQGRQRPKYLYTDGYPKTALLFGACHVDRHMVQSQGLIIVEGSIDAMRGHQFGHRNTVATLGTGISSEQVRIVSSLHPRRIFLFRDKDAAGVHGLEIDEQRFKGKYPLYVVRYPKGKSDPAEMEGRDWDRALERAIPMRKFNARRKSKSRSLTK